MSQPLQTRDFALPPLPSLVWWILLGLPALILLFVFALPDTRSSGPSLWLVTSLIVVVAIVIPVLALRRRYIRLSGDQLKVAATFYTRKIAISGLDLDKARVIDLSEHTELSPGIKLNGYGLPGFKAGHFLLRNRARAFCLLIGSERCLVLPQRDGKYLLLSAEQPMALLDELQRVARSSAAR